MIRLNELKNTILTWGTTLGMVFLCSSARTQFFHNYKEYLFVNDYNLALSAYTNPSTSGSPLSDNTNNTPSATTPVGGGTRVPGTSVNIPGAISQISRPDLQAAMKPDSVFLAPLNFSDNRQIWIVEYVSTACVNATFFTLRNKGTGKYLTIHYNCRLNVPVNDFSSCIGGGAPVTTLTLQDKAYEPPSSFCGRGQCISRFQKWRFGPIDENSFTIHNNAFELPYPAFLPGRTEFVSLKHFEITDVYPCKTSYWHYEVAHQPNRMGIIMLNRMELNSESVLSKNSKFRIIPNRPVTMVNLIDYPGFICPTELLKGDRDFSGQPLMEIKFELTLNTRRDRIIFNVTFKAEETKPDFSATRLTWSHPVYYAPPNATIKQLLGNIVWHYQTRTHINDESFKVMFPSDFIKSCEVIGDTLGDDISTDNNCNDDTRLGAFKFNKVAVIFD